MNKTDIKLNKYKHSLSVNVENKIDVDLDSSQKLFPTASMQSTIDKYEQYVKENDESDIYRLIFTINPVCSNVLFNHITEVIKGEGSNYCSLAKSYNDIKTTTFAKYKYKYDKSNILKCEFTTRDTSLSHPNMCYYGSSTYPYPEKYRYEHRCGIDIFNNHLLRKKEFVLINKTNSDTEKTSNRWFNTLFDSLRDPYGDNEKGVVEVTKKANNNTDVHVYNMDNIYSFNESITKNLKEVDGWFGFINQSQLKVSNLKDESSNDICINKIINNKKECDFIDLYPDRTLYSFVPKWNKFRNRVENNWDYCITYPYKNNYDCDLIHHKLNNSNQYVDGFVGSTDEVIEFENETAYTLNLEGKNLLIKTNIKHNLKPGNKVLIDIVYTVTPSMNEFILHCYAPVMVTSVGNGGYDSDYYFSIAFNDINSQMLQILSNTNIIGYHFRIRRLVNDKPCKYYMRVFKKLPCFENTQYYIKDKITDADINDALVNNGFNTTLNKLAFAKNAYGDDISQILFNDDIVTTGLYDNLGRELSMLYLTIVKRNKGHKEWYEDGMYNTDDIEYSHCFGEVTSGFDLPVYSNLNNVHRLHNIPTGSYELDIFPKSDISIEKDITIDGVVTNNNTRNYEFIGDIVELDEDNLIETVLEKIQHRFNTEQREIVNDEYSALTIDRIASDDYTGGFKGDTDINAMHCEISGVTKYYRANLSPEGYYYQPHYPIQLREYDTTINEGYHTPVQIKTIVSVVGDTYSVITEDNYYFNINDTIYLFNKKTKEKHLGVIVSVGGVNFTSLKIKISSIQGSNLYNFNIFKPNILKPTTAYELNDGTGRYIWKDFVSVADIKTTSELYNIPFTNGAHYIHKNINFYLKRQDPYGDYGLAPGLDNYGGEKCITALYGDLEIIGTEKDVTYGDYFEEGDNNIC